MDTQRGRASWRGQLTLRGVAIGSIGCVIITASSAYTALKLGALPWPIVFAAVISLFFLKLLGNASLNEANVTHTIMSAGAMVAGARIVGMKITHLNSVGSLTSLCRITAKMNPSAFCTTKVITR